MGSSGPGPAGGGPNSYLGMVFTLVYVRIDLSYFQLQFSFSYRNDLRVQ